MSGSSSGDGEQTSRSRAPNAEDYRRLERKGFFRIIEWVSSQEACRRTTSTEVDKCNLRCVGLFFVFCSVEILFQARMASEIYECEIKIFWCREQLQ